jgi:hypothetical protein
MAEPKTAIHIVGYFVARLPFGVEVIQTDNSAEFQTAFHWHVLDKGINHEDYAEVPLPGSLMRLRICGVLCCSSECPELNNRAALVA